VSEEAIKVGALSGDVDVETRTRTRALLNGLLAAERAILDLTQVDYIDSSGITELMLADNRRREAGVDPMRLVVARGTSVARVIELTGLGEFFAIFDSLESAQSHV
jgi:anti-sigma B factor antagonist